MFLGIITVVLVDVILFLIIRLAHAQWAAKDVRVPVAYAAMLFCICVISHLAATHTLGRAGAGQRDALVALVVSAVFGFVPIWAYVHMLLLRVGAAEPPEVDLLAQARSVRMAGDIEGALRLYLECYQADTDSPRPLFAGVAMLLEANDFVKAGKLLRQIMDRFDKRVQFHVPSLSPRGMKVLADSFP